MKRSIALIGCLLMFCAVCGVVGAQQPQARVAQTADLAAMNIEDLMNIEVTSVSKKEQKMSQVATAMFVITQEDIGRSGATNLPDLLRMAPGVDVGIGMDPTFLACQRKGVLNASHAHATLSPDRCHSLLLNGKEPLAVAMSSPPLPQFFDHARSDGHVTVFAPFGVLNVQPGRIFPPMNIPRSDADGLPDSQAAMIDQAQAGAKAGLAQHSQDALDFLLAQDQGQWFRPGDAQILKHRPIQAHFECLSEKGAQGDPGLGHGAAPPLLVLAQKHVILAELVFLQRGWVTLEVFGQKKHQPDVPVFGGWSIIFEFDKLLILSDRRIVSIDHKGAA